MLGGADNPNGELQSYIIGANINGSAKTQPVKRRKTLPVRAVFPPKISHGTPSAGQLAIPVTRAGNLLSH